MQMLPTLDELLKWTANRSEQFLSMLHTESLLPAWVWAVPLHAPHRVLVSRYLHESEQFLSMLHTESSFPPTLYSTFDTWGINRISLMGQPFIIYLFISFTT